MKRLDRLFLPVSLTAILVVFLIGVVMLVSTTPKMADGASSRPPLIDCRPLNRVDPPETFLNPELKLSSYDDVEKAISLPLPVRNAFRESFVGVSVSRSDGVYRGTGFVVESKEGIGVVTDFHVVADLVCEPPEWKMKLVNMPQFIAVHDKDHTFSAEIVRYDAGKDLVLLRLATNGVKKKPINIDQDERVDPSTENRFAFGVYADQTVDRVGVVTLRKIWRSPHPPYGALIDYFGGLASEPVGALWGLVRLGFSGSCALNESGFCNGVVNLIRFSESESETFYLPAAKLVEFLESK